MATMFGSGGRAAVVSSIAKALPNSSLISLRPTTLKPDFLSFQFAARSSQLRLLTKKKYASELSMKLIKRFSTENPESYSWSQGDETDIGNAADEASAAAHKAKESTKEEARSMAEKVKGTAEAAKVKSKEGAETMREKVKETAEAANEKTKKGGVKAVDAAQTVGGKAAQTVQGAWEAAKDATQKIKEKVVGKDETSSSDSEDELKDDPSKDARMAADRQLEVEKRKQGGDIIP